MAWLMGDRAGVRALAKEDPRVAGEAAVAQAVADALLRAVGRQAIIAAAADAVAALEGCRGGSGAALNDARLTALLTTVRPGGGQEDSKENPEGQEGGNG